MDRRRFLVTSIAGALAGPLAVEAQQAGKVYRIGVLWGVPEQAAGPYRDALEGGLRALGWIEGVNVSFTHRFPNAVQEVRDLAAQIVALKPDVIVAATNPVIQELKAATASIPIVMIYAITPVEVGFIRALNHPGGNITGLAMDGDLQMVGKYFEALRAMLPKAKTVVVMYNVAFFKAAGLELVLPTLEAIAPKLGFTLRVSNVNGRVDIRMRFSR